MISRIKQTLFILTIALLPSFVAAQSYTLEQFGGRANDPSFDNGPALTRMLEAMGQQSPGFGQKIELGKGDYHIWDTHLPKHEVFISNHDHAPERSIAFYLEGLSDLTIVGEDTRLLFHGRLIPFYVTKCRDIRLQGFSIDYPRPALTQITIRDVRGDVAVAELLPESQWRLDDGNLILECEGFDVVPKFCMPFSSDGHMKWGRADVGFNPSRLERQQDGAIAIHGWDETPHLSKGDTYVLRPTTRPTPGIVISDSQGVMLRDVVVHYAEGMGLLAQNSDDLTLDHFAVRRPQNSARRFTTQADATHFSGCRGYIRSLSGLYENMADDAINVHGTYLRVDSIPDAKRVQASFAHHQSFGFGWYREGDKVAFIDRATLRPLFSTVCVGYSQPSTHEAVLVLKDPLPQALLDGAYQLAVENLTAYPSVDFAYNTVRDNRARGALFSTRMPVSCHDNLFDHTHGSAILLCGDANGWYESGPCTDITIARNRFVNSLTAIYQFTHAIISIDPEIRQKFPGFSYHGRVEIRDNRFETFPSPLYYAESVESLVIEGNQIVPNEDYAPIFTSTDSRIIP